MLRVGLSCLEMHHCCGVPYRMAGMERVEEGSEEAGLWHGGRDIFEGAGEGL